MQEKNGQLEIDLSYGILTVRENIGVENKKSRFDPALGRNILAEIAAVNSFVNATLQILHGRLIKKLIFEVLELLIGPRMIFFKIINYQRIGRTQHFIQILHR